MATETAEEVKTEAPPPQETEVTTFLVAMALGTGARLTPTQRTSSTFDPEPTIAGTRLQRGRPPLKLTAQAARLADRQIRDALLSESITLTMCRNGVPIAKATTWDKVRHHPKFEDITLSARGGEKATKEVSVDIAVEEPVQSMGALVQDPTCSLCGKIGCDHLEPKTVRNEGIGMGVGNIAGIQQIELVTEPADSGFKEDEIDIRKVISETEPLTSAPLPIQPVQAEVAQGKVQETEPQGHGGKGKKRNGR